MPNLDTHFTIDGAPMPVPDAGVELHCADLDASDAGRDEAGYLHRHLVRSKVRSWRFTYGWLSKEEMRYLEGLLADKDTFQFSDGETTVTAYCAKTQTSLFDRNLGLYQGTTFQIIEC